MEVEHQENCSCGVEHGGEHGWTARDSAVIARVEQYLDESDSMKVEVEELELLLGPEDSEVNLRHILMYVRKKKEHNIFEIFCSTGPSEFLVVSRARWDESRRRVQEVECSNRLPEGCYVTRTTVKLKK